MKEGLGGRQALEFMVRKEFAERSKIASGGHGARQHMRVVGR